MRRLNTKEFIEKSKKIHNNMYDYSLVKYENNHTKVKIVCKKHGLLDIFPSNHLSGTGCKKCSIDRTKLGLKNFIENAKIVHGNKYDYSLVEYKNNSTKIKIVCKNCENIFEQKPNNHIIAKSGCPKCSHKNGGLKNTLTQQDFLKSAIKIHSNKYDYSLVEYKNSKSKVKIICKIHGIFEQTPNSHVSQKQGCPKCKSSKGEKIIREWLIKNNIKFEEQKKFNDCRGRRRPLPFDSCVFIDDIITPIVS